MVRALLVMGGLLGCLGRGPRVELPAPPPDLPPGQRVELFKSYQGVTEQVEIETRCKRSTGGCSSNAQLSLLLANGLTVHHAEDLLPMVPPHSDTARHARAGRSAMWAVLAFGAVGMASMVFGGYTYLTTDERDGTPSEIRPRRNLGIGMFFGGLIVGIGGAYYFRARALSAANRAFQSYNDDLAERLRVCVTGLTVVPCDP